MTLAFITAREKTHRKANIILIESVRFGNGSVEFGGAVYVLS